MRPLALVLGLGLTVGAQPTVRFDRETMRLRSASVAAVGAAWRLTLSMENDNGVQDGVLPTSYRRWWHCEIGNLRATGETLDVTVERAGYSDVILPVWALSTDGVTFSPYTRVPTTALPTVQGGTRHLFTLQTPAGVRAIRLAKYFPHTVADKDAFLAGIAGHRHVRSTAAIGTSRLGRPIHMVELTDAGVADAGKTRVWIHAAVHPSETTAYFVAEGLVAFLLSGDPWAELLLDHAIVDIVPMANPDGCARGNYRTNADSVNLEDEWAQPYASTVPEIVALRTQIERFMGTPATPGANPIRVLLNLHASHDVAYPFHFQHVANPSFDLVTNRTGVLPVVNQLEGQWIAAFRARSAFTARGTTQSSTMGAPARPFVESMMHDRWTIDSRWAGNGQAPVMAITYEGTYRLGPDGMAWNTPEDYRANGAELGRALADTLGLEPGATVSRYGSDCNGPTLAVTALGGSGVTLRFDYIHTDLSALLLLVLGSDVQALPLPASPCLLRTSPAATLFLQRNVFGSGRLDLPMPLVPGFAVQAQALSWSAAASFGSTAGASIRANF
ncbi:MAG: M14 family zinc carboxypeptidase [Planctomycetota bacterium]